MMNSFDVFVIKGFTVLNSFFSNVVPLLITITITLLLTLINLTTGYNTGLKQFWLGHDINKLGVKKNDANHTFF